MGKTKKTPTAIVTELLGGEVRVEKAVRLTTVAAGPRGPTHWTASIWSCHGTSTFQLLSARGDTKKKASEALDSRLLEVARELVRSVPLD